MKSVLESFGKMCNTFSVKDGEKLPEIQKYSTKWTKELDVHPMAVSGSNERVPPRRVLTTSKHARFLGTFLTLIERKLNILKKIRSDRNDLFIRKLLGPLGLNLKISGNFGATPSLF